MRVDKDIKYPFTNKELAAREHIDDMTKRLLTMFTYDGTLPDTLPQDSVEEMILDGYIYVTYINDDEILNYPNTPQIKGGLYAFNGIEGTYPDFYGRSTVLNISHPRLKGPIRREIGVDCVKVKNDSLGTGLYTLNKRYATMLVENEISLLIADINVRTPAVMVAETDSARKSAEEFLNQVNKGSVGVITGKSFTDNNGITSLPYNNTASQSITNLIELEQYLKASWYNEIGLNSNYNMKREALNTAENDMNYDALVPLPLNMLTSRQKGWDKVNEIFGTNIKVRFNEPFRQLLETTGDDESLNEEQTILEAAEIDTEDRTEMDNEAELSDVKGDSEQKDEVEVNVTVSIAETDAEGGLSTEPVLEEENEDENQGNK